MLQATTRHKEEGRQLYLDKLIFKLPNIMEPRYEFVAQYFSEK